MKNKDRRKHLLADAIAADPDILRGQKLTRILLAIWLGSRLLCFVAELFCAKAEFITLSFLNFVLLPLFFMLAVWIDNGTKQLPVLALLSGVLMVVFGFRNRLYISLSLSLPFVIKVYIFTYLLTSWIQIVVMLCLLFIPLCTKYTFIGDRITKKLKNQPEGPHL